MHGRHDVVRVLREGVVRDAPPLPLLQQARDLCTQATQLSQQTAPYSATLRHTALRACASNSRSWVKSHHSRAARAACCGENS